MATIDKKGTTKLFATIYDIRHMVAQGIKYIQFFDDTEGELVVENSRVYIRVLKNNILMDDGETTKGLVYYPFERYEPQIKWIRMGKSGVFVASRKHIDRPLILTGKGYQRK